MGKVWCLLFRNRNKYFKKGYEEQRKIATGGAREQMKFNKFRGWLAAVVMTTLFGVQSFSSAQTPLLEAGNAIVTGFSGTATMTEQGLERHLEQDFEQVVIDSSAPALRILDLSRLPKKSTHEPVANQTKFQVPSKDIGQVFAVTLDHAEQPNIYAAATSAFGLQIVGTIIEEGETSGKLVRLSTGQPEARWAEGQFGALAGGGPGSIWKINGSTGEVGLFANISSNSGPGFGGLSFSPMHRQFYVSDLDDGLIHRLSQQGKVLSSFDHGIEGRAAAGLTPVVDDSLDRINIEIPSFHSNDPTTWGLTANQRRVHALAVHRNRLFYAVANQREVWSIGLDKETGDFSGTARLEVAAAERTGVTIADIEFSGNGEMVVAERRETKSPRDYRSFVTEDQSGTQATLCQFQPSTGSDARWIEVGQFRDPARSSEGAVAIGLGYNPTDGKLDPTACGSSLWMTLSPQAQQAGIAVVSSTFEFRQSGTAPFSFSNSATLFDPLSKGQLGDIDIYEGNCVKTSQPSYSDPDLELSLTPSAAQCTPGEICSFTLRVKNHGPAAFTAPISLRAKATPRTFFEELHDELDWTCQREDNEILCRLEDAHLVPGTSIILPVSLKPDDKGNSLEVCSALIWSDMKIAGLDQRFLDAKKSSVRELQQMLKQKGYDPGPVDGVMGNKTRNAIRNYERDNNLPVTGKKSEDLMIELGGNTAKNDEIFVLPGGDRLFENNQDCDAVYILTDRHKETLSALHENNLSSWHRDSRSAIHNPRVTRIHRSNNSSLHENPSSRFRNPKRLSEHKHTVSRLPRTKRSLWHVKGMSEAHNPRLSSLHRKYLSAWHRAHSSKLHHPKLSSFHSTSLSSAHLKDKSKIHRKLLSGLHQTAASSWHQKGISKIHSSNQSAEHQVARSQFHQSGQSRNHIKHQSLAHLRAISLIHTKHRSSWHKTDTTAIHQPELSSAHNPTVSSFHLQSSSRLHAKNSSELSEFVASRGNQDESITGKSGFREARVHQTAKSNNHRKATSQVHWTAASRKHSTSISAFHKKARSFNHKTGESAFHNRLISRAHRSHDSSAHDQKNSVLHETNRSKGHNRLLSKFHQDQKSRFHLRGQSTYHKSRVSAGHNKKVSKFHEKNRSDNHSSSTSKYHNGTVSRLHIKRGSNWHKQASSEIHDPQVSSVETGIANGHERNLSRFHQSFRSSLHKANSSRLHKPRLSQMHLRYDSAWHRSSTSVFRIPTQPITPLPGEIDPLQPTTPTFHLPSQSLQNGTKIKIHRTFQSRAE